MSVRHHHLLPLVAALAGLLALTPGRAVHAASLTPPPPAGADCQTTGSGTICRWSTTMTVAPSVTPNTCTVGSETFNLVIGFTVTRRYTTSYDAAGNETLERRHVSFDGTVANSSALSKVVPYRGDWTITTDIATGIMTFTGDNRHTNVPGVGVVSFASGRDVYDPATDTDLFLTPQYDINFFQGLCSVLA